MPDERKCEERDGAQREHSGDSVVRVFFIGFDGAFGGDDGGDAADRGADGQQGSKLRSEPEGAAERGHEEQRDADFNDHQNQAHAAELEHVPEDEARPEQDDARLEPEFIRGEARTESCGNAHGIRDHEADENGP